MATKLEQADIAKKYLSDLIKKTEIMHSSFQQNDNVGRLITYFMLKQRHHAMSVIKLDPSMDMALIARTMIEGVMTLSWALEKPEERCGNWFKYSYVDDYKLLQKKKKSGIKVSLEDEERVIQNYNNYASEFLKKNSKRHHDNFRKGANLGNILKDNTDLEYFYQHYKYFSDWAHWGSQSLDQVVNEGFNELSYNESNHGYRYAALRVSFASLLMIASKTNVYFELNQDEALAYISNELIMALEK